MIKILGTLILNLQITTIVKKQMRLVTKRNDRALNLLKICSSTAKKLFMTKCKRKSDKQNSSARFTRKPINIGKLYKDVLDLKRST